MATVYRGKPCKITKVIDPDSAQVEYLLLDQTKPAIEVTITNTSQANAARTSIGLYEGAIGTIFLSQSHLAANSIEVFPWDPKEPPGEAGGERLEYVGVQVEVVQYRVDRFGSAAPIVGSVPEDRAAIAHVEIGFRDRTGRVHQVSWLNGRVATWAEMISPELGQKGWLYLERGYLDEFEIPYDDDSPRTTNEEWGVREVAEESLQSEAARVVARHLAIERARNNLPPAQRADPGRIVDKMQEQRSRSRQRESLVLVSSTYARFSQPSK